MSPFSMNQPLTTEQLVSATGALLRVARVDEVCTQEEIALIRAFYEGNDSQSGAPAFETLLAASDTPVSTRLEPDQRDFVIAACAMVGYADGKLSPAEEETIRKIGGELNVANARVTEILSIVRDHLLAQFSHLPDSGAVSRVAQELAV